MVRNLKNIKISKLLSRTEIERVLDKKGYISLDQARGIAKWYGITKKSTVTNIFYNLTHVEYVSIWNPGTINFFKKIKLCPKFYNTTVAKRSYRIDKADQKNVTFCIYDGSILSDYEYMLDILISKGYDRVDTFPPLFKEYQIIDDRERKIIFWAENKVAGDKDLPEHMLESPGVPA